MCSKVAILSWQYMRGETSCFFEVVRLMLNELEEDGTIQQQDVENIL